MINVDGIYGALVEQWVNFPNISRAQFIAGVESRGIATQAEADLYVTAFLKEAHAEAMIDVQTWAALQARVQEAGVDRAARAGAKIHQEIEQAAEFRINRLTSQVAQLDAGITTAEGELANALLGKQEILDRFPAGTIRDDTLKILDAGIGRTEGALAAGRRKLVELQEALAEIQG